MVVYGVEDVLIFNCILYFILSIEMVVIEVMVLILGVELYLFDEVGYFV